MPTSPFDTLRDQLTAFEGLPAKIHSLVEEYANSDFAQLTGSAGVVRAAGDEAISKADELVKMAKPVLALGGFYVSTEVKAKTWQDVHDHCMNAYNSTLDTNVNHIDDFWTGESARLYANAFSDNKDAIKLFADLASNAQTTLDDVHSACGDFCLAIVAALLGVVSIILGVIGVEAIWPLVVGIIAAIGLFYAAWSNWNSYVTKLDKDISTMTHAVQDNPIVKTGVWPDISGGASVAGTEGWTSK